MSKEYKSRHPQDIVDRIIEAKRLGMSSRAIAEDILGRASAKSTINDVWNAYNEYDVLTTSDQATLSKSQNKTFLPKILTLDIETAPLYGAVWQLWQQNVGLNQIKDEWFLLSYSAKWLHEPASEVMYEDLEGTVHTQDDSALLKSLWDLLNECDIVLTQNGKKFDVKKINARFILNGFQPPSSYKHIDTLQIAKSNFGFTSNKLEWMTDKLCTKYKKLTHGKFAGFELWKQCLLDNPEAWKEMRDYNINDVLSLEELYSKLAPWDHKHPNFNLYSDSEKEICRCGSDNIVEYGYHYTGLSKFQRYRCNDCGAETRDRKNLFDKEKMSNIRLNA